MKNELITKYWPIFLLGIFLLYRYMKARKVREMIPEFIEKDAQIIDVRSEAEFANCCNSASKNIPLNVLADNLDQLDKSKPVIVCCASGNRSATAARLLKSKGFNVFDIGAWTNLK